MDIRMDYTETAVTDTSRPMKKAHLTALSGLFPSLRRAGSTPPFRKKPSALHLGLFDRP